MEAAKKEAARKKAEVDRKATAKKASAEAAAPAAAKKASAEAAAPAAAKKPNAAGANGGNPVAPASSVGAASALSVGVAPAPSVGVAPAPSVGVVPALAGPLAPVGAPAVQPVLLPGAGAGPAHPADDSIETRGLELVNILRLQHLRQLTDAFDHELSGIHSNAESGSFVVNARVVFGYLRDTNIKDDTAKIQELIRKAMACLPIRPLELQNTAPDDQRVKDAVMWFVLIAMPIYDLIGVGDTQSASMMTLLYNKDITDRYIQQYHWLNPDQANLFRVYEETTTTLLGNATNNIQLVCAVLHLFNLCRTWKTNIKSGMVGSGYTNELNALALTMSQGMLSIMDAINNDPVNEALFAANRVLYRFRVRNSLVLVDVDSVHLGRAYGLLDANFFVGHSAAYVPVTEALKTLLRKCKTKTAYALLTTINIVEYTMTALHSCASIEALDLKLRSIICDVEVYDATDLNEHQDNGAVALQRKGNEGRFWQVKATTFHTWADVIAQTKTDEVFSTGCGWNQSLMPCASEKAEFKIVDSLANSLTIAHPEPICAPEAKLDVDDIAMLPIATTESVRPIRALWVYPDTYVVGSHYYDLIESSQSGGSVIKCYIVPVDLAMKRRGVAAPRGTGPYGRIVKLASSV
jgi:hypothetical protein